MRLPVVIQPTNVQFVAALVGTPDGHAIASARRFSG